MDKTKFIRDPHLDSEGFVMQDAKCLGCKPEDMCPRSGHCERYESPLRDVYGISADMIGNTEHDVVLWANPKGWQEVDGVTLPSVAAWADLGGKVIAENGARAIPLDERCNRCPPVWAAIEQSDLDKVHAIWSKADGK